MRRLLKFLGLTLLLLVLVLVAAYVFRQEVVRYVLDEELEALGLQDLVYEVESVEFEQASVRGIVWQDGERLSLERLTVTYDPWNLVSGEVLGIEIEGLRLKLDLTGTAAPLEGLPIPQRTAGTASGESEEPGSGPLPTDLPPIALIDAEVQAETLAGPIETRFEGDILPDGLGGLAGAFDLTVAGDLGRLRGSLSITHDFDGLTTGAALLEEGNLDLPGGSIGGLGGEFDFRIGGGEPPRVRGEFTLSGIEVPEQLFDAADLLLVLEDGQFLVEGLLRSPDRKAEATYKMTADRLLASPEITLESRIRLQAGSALWPLLGIQQPSRGTAAFRLDGQGTLPDIEALTVADGGIIGWLAAGDTRGRVQLASVDLTFPGAMESLAGEMVVDWGLIDGIVVAGLPKDAQITVAAFDRAWLASFDLPPDSAAALENGVAVTLPADSTGAEPRFRMEPSAGGHLIDLAGTTRIEATDGARAALTGVTTLDLTPTLEVVSLSLQGMALQAQELPVDGHVIGSLKIGGDLEGTTERLEGVLGINVNLLTTDLGDYPVQDLAVGGQFATLYEAARLELTLLDDGEVSMGQFLLNERPILPRPADGSVESSELALDWSSGDLILTHDTVAELGDERLVFGEEGSQVSVEGAFGRFRLVGRTNAEFDYAATLGLSEVAVTLPEFGLFLGNTEVAWIFPFPDEADAPGKITVGSGTVTTGVGRISGLTLEADATETETGIVLEGTGRGPSGVGRVAVRLEDDNATGKGGLTADWGPVTFKPGGLQPGQLLGFLGDFQQVAGKARVLLAFSWNEQSSSSAAKVTLSDVSFTHPSFDVEGLDTTIQFNRLATISTPPGQKLTARKVDIGMPLTDVRATLDIQPGRQTGYHFEDIAFTLAGGRFTIPALAYDPFSEQSSGTVGINGLDLALLTAELDISDFRMEGKMSGSLPIAYRLADEAITVSGGKLVNTTPGAIRYGKEGTASLRAGGDENFALALEALENFQFSTLDLTIDKKAAGETRLFIILEGNNPNVLDGYPFRININLETDLAQVLDALREGYRLNPDIFEGGWTFN